MFTYFRKNQENFSELSTIPREKGRDDKQNIPQLCNESPPAAREKGDPQAGQRGRLFAAGLSAAACFSCSARLGTAV